MQAPPILIVQPEMLKDDSVLKDLLTQHADGENSDYFEMKAVEYEDVNGLTNLYMNMHSILGPR